MSCVSLRCQALPQREAGGRRQLGAPGAGSSRRSLVVPGAQRQFRTIRENIDRKRIQKLAETNPDAVKLNPTPEPAGTESSGPPMALLAGGAGVLLLLGALLAGQS